MVTHPVALCQGGTASAECRVFTSAECLEETETVKDAKQDAKDAKQGRRLTQRRRDAEHDAEGTKHHGMKVPQHGD